MNKTHDKRIVVLYFFLSQVFGRISSETAKYLNLLFAISENK